MQFKFGLLKVTAVLIAAASCVDASPAIADPAAASAAAASATASEPPKPEFIRALPPEAKAAMLQKKERFDALPEEERNRLRQLNAEITTSAHSAQLQSTLDRYHEWLKSLSTKQRADLLELPTDKRIDRIKELMQEQERDRLRALGGKQLPEADVDAIFDWLENFMTQHEEKYLERLPEDYRKRLQDQEPESRRRSLMRGIIMRGPRSDFPLPMREDLDRLLPALTPATRATMESFKTPEEKQQLARQWIFSAMISKVLPPASEEDLRKVFNELPADQRERLERKTPEEVKRELTWRFHWKQWPGREGWRGPGFGPGFRPGSGGPGSGGPGSGGPGPGGPGNGRGDRPPPPRKSEPSKSDPPPSPGK